MSNKEKFFLKFGTIQTLLMAIYHFFIPFQFNWGKYLLEQSPTINWSLYSIHNYFCFNLLTLATFLLFFLVKRKDSIQTITILSIIILLFWIFSFIYQIVDPMPLPDRLYWLGILLPGLAFFNAILFAVPLKSLLKKSKSSIQ